MIGQLQKIDLLKISGEFADHVRGIFRTNPERDHGADIAEDGMPDIWFKLVQVLVGYGKSDPVFAHFRKHVDDSQRSKALKLVNIDEEVSPLLGWDIRSAEGGQSDGCD